MKTLNLVLSLIGLVTFAQATIAAVTPKEITAYIERSPRAEEWHAARNPVIQILNANLPKSGFGRAVEQLALTWHIERAAAANLVEAVLLDEIAFGSLRKDSTLEDRIHKAYFAGLDGAESSPEVWALLLGYLDDQRLCAAPGLDERYFRQTAASAGFLTSTAWNCSEWILSYPRYQSMTPLAWWYLYQYFLNASPEGWIAALHSWLQTASVKDTHPLDAARLHVLRLYLTSLAKFGLSSELIATFEALTSEERQALLQQASASDIILEGKVIASPSGSMDAMNELRMAWILSLLDAGRGEEAAYWLSALKIPRGTEHATAGDRQQSRVRVFTRQGEDEGEFLHQLVSGPGNVDPFDLFVGDGERGLLWSVVRHSALTAHAAARFMSQAGYARIAQNILDEHACQGLISDPWNKSQDARLKTLPMPFSEAFSRFTALIAAAAAGFGRCEHKKHSPASEGAIDNVSHRVYREIPLRGSLLQNTVRKVPKRLLPKDSFVVRSERKADHLWVITLSQDVDPVGEVSGGGYWLRESTDGGKTWRRPLYLGLQQYQPYIVSEESKLPFVEGRTLRLEVEVKELDEESITFPPVGLKSKREAKGLYIELSLDELESDVDQDGLPDLLEEKLRTNPRNPDTDSDGIGDAYDDLPQVSALSSPHALSSIVIDVLHRITGYEASAIQMPMRDPKSQQDIFTDLALGSSPQRPMDYMFINADPALFSGLALRGNIILLTDKDVDYLTKRFGLCFPISFPAIWHNRDATHAVVKWSAGWVGGTLYYQLIDGKWVAEVASKWIT